MRQFKRADRIRYQMLRDVQSLLDEELAAKLDSMVTFTDVEITGDLKFAKIYYSVLGNDKQKDRVAVYLEKITGRAQSRLGRLLSIKFIPKITFVFDPSVERGIRIQELLNSISQDNKQSDAGNS